MGIGSSRLFLFKRWNLGSSQDLRRQQATFDPEEIGYGQIEMKRTKPAEMDPFFHRAFLALRCKATVSTSHRHIAFKSATGTGGPTASWSSMAHGDRLLVSRFYSVDSRDGFLLSNYQCQTQNQAQILRLRRYEKVNVRISCGSLILGFTTHCGQ